MARVLFVSYTAEWTGPTKSLLLLLQHVRERFAVAVLTSEEGPFVDALRAEGIPVHVLRSLSKRSIPAMNGLIRREGFDLVYGNNHSGSSENAFIAAKIAGRPFVCHLRGLGDLREAREHLFLRFVDAIVAVSDACALSYRGRIPAEKVHVVHNGLDPSPFQGPVDGAREHLLEVTGLPEDATILVYVAHVRPLKGQDYCIRALARLAQDRPSARLVLIGALRDRGYLGLLQELIDHLDLGGHVTMLGYREDVPLLLRGGDIYMHSSDSEAHPRVVLEAMAAGLPVVAFDVGGIGETILDGETGYLVPPGDTEGLAGRALELARDPSLRRRFGALGRRRVELDFSPERTAEGVGRIIERVLR